MMNENRKILTSILLASLIISLVVIVWRFTPVHASGITMVQGYANGASPGGITGGLLTVTQASAPTAGDVNILFYASYCSDNYAFAASPSQAGVVWTQAVMKTYVYPYNGGQAKPCLMVAIWFGVVGSGASATITISLTGGGGAEIQVAADVCEYSGVATSNFLDQVATNTPDTSSTSDTGTTSTTSSPYELWIGGIVAYNHPQTNPTNGFNLLDGNTLYGGYISLAYLAKIVSTTGTANSGTSGAGGGIWLGCIATFVSQPQIIYINADGSITPVGVPIVTSDNITYTFTGNITYPTYYGVVVERSNIVIDGAGYTVQGNNSGNGIYGTNINNVTIKNLNVENFGFGIYLYYAPNSIISGNNVIANTYNGIRVGFSSNYSIIGNNIANNGGGLLLAASSNNSVSGNVFTDNGLFVEDSFENSVENNTVNGRPLVYLEGVADYNVSDAGQVILVRCDSIGVENLNLSGASVGVELWQTNNTVISENNMANNFLEGVWLVASSNNSISGNNIGNSVDGCGVFLLSGASNNNISGNNLTNMNDGVYFSNQDNSNNTISGNDIVNNDYGIGFNFPSCDNKIYHNNFINNTCSAIGDNQSVNVWDDGYPSGGNYWSDYNGTDLFSGPYQNITGSDGIGDTPYAIDAINVDNYPLMGPFSNLYSNATQTSVSCISNSTVSGIQLNGTTISFDVSGEPGTTGFCTVIILHSMLLPPYTIEIDGNPVSYITVYEDATQSVLYFTYQHSTHEVTISGIPAYTSGGGGKMPDMN